MNIVFLLGSYYPEPSPTALVAQNIIDEVKGQHHVSVICYQNGKETLDGLSVDGVQIYSLKNRFHLYEKKLTQALSREHGIRKNLYKALYVLYYPIKAFRSAVLFPSGERWYIREAVKMLKQLDKMQPIDFIVSVCAPFAAHMTGFLLKKSNSKIKWVTFTPDYYYAGATGSKGFLYREIIGKKCYWEEINILTNADSNLILNNYINAELFEKIKGNRNIPLYLKLIDMKIAGVSKFPTDGINCLFCGSFLSSVREPHYALQAFEKAVEINRDIKFYMYGNLFFPEVIHQAVQSHKDNIFSHNSIPVKEIRALMNSADILIDIGNMIDDYRPSKLYEYISTGRPIISFCNNGKFDDELNLYPLALQIDTQKTNIAEAANMIVQFVSVNCKKKVSDSMIKTIYKKNTVEEFTKTVNYVFDITTYEDDNNAK